MAGRRAVTEGMLYDDEDGAPIDINNLNDDELRAAMERAYAMGVDDDDEYGDE
jgi:hypothetical protein